MNRVAKFFLSLIIFAAVCYGGLVWFVNHEVAKGIDQAVAETPGLTLTYTDLSVDIFDHTVTLDDVEATWPGGQSFLAEEVAILKFDQKNEVPHFIQAEAHGAVISATRANLGEYADMLRLIDVTALHGDLAFDYEFNPANKALTFNALTINDRTLGDLTLSGVLNNIDITDVRPEQTVGLKLGAADLTFTDRQLVERVLAVIGKSVGMDVNATRIQFGEEIRGMADYAEKIGNVQAAATFRALRSFVREPGTLTVSARPEEPAPLLYLFMGRDIYDNLRLLNLSVKASSSVAKNNQ